MPSGIDWFVDTRGTVGGRVTLPAYRFGYGSVIDGDRKDELQVWAVWASPPWRDLRWWSPACKRAWAGFALGRTIRRFTRRTGGRYSHLAFRKGSTVWEATEKGIVESAARDYARYNLHVHAYAIRADAGQQRAAKLRILREASVHTPYDFGDIADRAIDAIGARLGIDVRVTLGAGTEALICSEFVPYAYQAAGPDLAAALSLGELAEFVPDHIAHLYARRPDLCEFRGEVVF